MEDLIQIFIISYQKRYTQHCPSSSSIHFKLSQTRYLTISVNHRPDHVTPLLRHRSAIFISSHMGLGTSKNKSKGKKSIRKIFKDSIYKNGKDLCIKKTQNETMNDNLRKTNGYDISDRRKCLQCIKILQTNKKRLDTLQEKMDKDTKEKIYKLQKWSSKSFREFKSTSLEPTFGWVSWTSEQANHLSHVTMINS